MSAGTGGTRLQAASGALGVLAAMIGAAALIGWAFGVSFLKAPRPEWPAMKFNTAVGLAACGSALAGVWAARSTPGRAGLMRRVSTLLGCVALLVGLLSLLEYATGANLGIDELLISDLEASPEDAPGRPAIPTALALGFSGAAAVALSSRRRLPPVLLQAPALVTFGIALYVLTLYVYGAQVTPGDASTRGVAVHTSLGLLCLALGVLLARPDEGVMRVFTSPHAGGYLARSLTPVFLTVPLLVGWLRLEGELAGLYDLPVGVALNVLVISGGLFACVWWVADSLNRVDSEARRQGIIFEAVLNCVAEGVVVADPAGKMIVFNPAAERIIGRGRTEAPSPEWSREYGVFRPDGTTPFPTDELPLVRAIHGVSTDDVEQYLRNSAHPGGVRVSVSGRPLIGPDGSRMGGVVVVHDITERRNAEERFRLVMSAAPTGLLMVDQEGRIVLANERAGELFRYGRDEILGKMVEDLMPERFRGRHPGLRAGYLRDPRIGAMGPGRRLFGLRRDGSEFPIEIRLGPLQTPTGTFVLAAIEDITERRKAEETIEALNDSLSRSVADLKAINGELEAFSYSVSHDLRAPLRGILGFAKILSDDYGTKLDSNAQGHLSRIMNAAGRMGQLIDGLLNLSRITRKEIRAEPVDLSRIGALVTEELRRSSPERETRVEVAGGMTALGDPQLLHVVVSNLLANAWKYTSKRDGARIEFGARGQDGRTVYYVRDNGAGFDMRYADKLFGAFQRLHSASEFEGSGIGLATVQRIIQRHGGRVWAEAEVDRGATFYFTL